MRFAPPDSIAYDGPLTVAHTSLTADYGNTVANATAGIISLTGNGKVAVSGTPATVTWAMFSGTTIVMSAVTVGAVSATSGTLTGLANKNVANNAARFDSLDGTWPPESARNAARYIEFTVPVTTGTFALDSISVDAGSGGGSNMRWDIVYSPAADFSAPTAYATFPCRAKQKSQLEPFARAVAGWPIALIAALAGGTMRPQPGSTMPQRTINHTPRRFGNFGSGCIIRPNEPRERLEIT